MQFIDLNRQYETIEDNVKSRIERVLQHKAFIMGPEISELEDRLAKFTGRKYAFGCSNGTDALVIPLMAYELKENDAVFLPSFTFFATAESVSIVGGTPVFVDSDETHNIDTADLRSRIEKTISEGKLNPRGIIAVDLFGLPADYDEIQKIADEFGLFVISDTAQGFGGEYKGKRAGSFGDVASTSFFPAKPLGCYGDGGAIFTDDDELAEKIRSIRVHGQGSSRYDNVRIGINGRLDTIQAAILLAKLDIFEDEIVKRQHVAQRYMENLSGVVETPIIPSNCLSAWAQIALLAKDNAQRELIIKSLKEFDIPCMVYYQVPMHMQTAYKELNYKPSDLPVCSQVSSRIFSLPMHPYLKDEEIDFICDKIKSIIL